jgi:hypothetical protein
VTRRLCRSRFFAIELLDATRDAHIPVAETGIPEVWMTLDGACRWTTASGALDAPASATVLRPAHVEAGEVAIAAGSRVLRTTCASHLDRAM